MKLHRKKILKNVIILVVAFVALFSMPDELFASVKVERAGVASHSDGLITKVYADFFDDLKEQFDNDPAKLPFCEDEADCNLKKGLDQSKDILDDNNFTTTESLPELIISWTNFALGFLFFIAMTAIIVAGYMWVTDFGSGGNKEKAINIITYVVVGILVILVAYPIVLTILRATSQNP